MGLKLQVVAEINYGSWLLIAPYGIETGISRPTLHLLGDALSYELIYVRSWSLRNST